LQAGKADREKRLWRISHGYLSFVRRCNASSCLIVHNGERSMRFKDQIIFVTGGAGFIGSTVVRHLLRDTGASVVNIDKLTYAANVSSLQQVNQHPRYAFHKVDICDGPALRHLFDRYAPHVVMNLAAESHVDRSIDGPAEFIQT